MTSNYDDEDNELTQTFKTAVDLTMNSFGTTSQRSTMMNESELYKLPPVVNFVALRETFLSEAPFVKRTNRMFWKKWIDSKQYSNSLALCLRFITGCISDNGSVNIGKLYQVDNNLLIDRLSSNISEMLTLERDYLHHSSAHDILFSRLPEVLAYMIINSLLTSLPKLARVYYSGQFRELLLDWLNEIVGGIRITNPRKDREWLFTDATDMGVALVNHTKTFPGTIRPVNSSSGNNSAPASPNKTPALSPLASTRKTMRSTINSAGSGMGNASVEGGGGTTDNTPKLYNAVVAAKEEERYRREMDTSRFSRATSAFVLENSPLVRKYLNGGRSVRIHDLFICFNLIFNKTSYVVLGVDGRSVSMPTSIEDQLVPSTESTISLHAGGYHHERGYISREENEQEVVDYFAEAIGSASRTNPEGGRHEGPGDETRSPAHETRLSNPVGHPT